MNRAEQTKHIDSTLAQLGLARPTTYKLPHGRQSAWRVAPEPHVLTQEQQVSILNLGSVMHRFYQAADRLYHVGLSEKRYSFVVEYLDQGKPAGIVNMGRHPRFKGVLPLIYRPDLLWTSEGFVATEFDSIPGGAGLLSGMERVYSDLGFQMTDTAQAFHTAITLIHRSGLLAIVVSDESIGYRDEQAYLAARMQEMGLPAVCLAPAQVEVTHEGAFYLGKRIGTIYRFFELFDIDNVPNGWEMLHLAQSGLVKMTPPPKAYLEEKLWFAFLHHPILESYWINALDEPAFGFLKRMVPCTHILDSRPVPPHAVIPGLTFNGQPVHSYDQLLSLPRGERAFVLKPSGFSPSAWGSHGVVLGRDLTTRAWNEAVRQALRSFDHLPYVLQPFHYSATCEQEYYDFRVGDIQTFTGKSRFCPFFFNTGKTVTRGGTLVTTCPVEKPLIHGMTDACLVPAQQ